MKLTHSQVLMEANNCMHKLKQVSPTSLVFQSVKTLPILIFTHNKIELEENKGKWLYEKVNIYSYWLILKEKDGTEHDSNNVVNMEPCLSELDRLFAIAQFI